MNKSAELENMFDSQTQTQTQNTLQWTQENSPKIEKPWGRLYPTYHRLKTLGINHRSPRILQYPVDNYDMCKEQFTVGRGEACDIILTQNDVGSLSFGKISKLHFVLTRQPGADSPVYIEDRSHNGTFINGQKLGKGKRRILMNDDQIAITHPAMKVYVFHDLYIPSVDGIPESITSVYYVSRILGSGACGVVRLVFHKLTCQQYAMKHIVKGKLSGFRRSLNDPERIMNEVRIMKALDHPGVIRIKDIVDMPDAVFLIMEFMEGGELFTRIIDRNRLTEPNCKLIFYQMAKAVKYLHDLGITHRDIKPENVLLSTSKEDTLVKVSDFGLSKFVDGEVVMRTFCGTPMYVAPEVFRTNGSEPYTEKIDVWSLGVVLFTCLSGCVPFSVDNSQKRSLQEQISKGLYNFKHPSWKSVTKVAQHLILKMLTVDPENRLSIDEVLMHPWLQDANMKRRYNKVMKEEYPSEISSDSVASSSSSIVEEPPLKRQRLHL